MKTSTTAGIVLVLAFAAGTAHADVATAVRVLNILAQLQQTVGPDVVLVAPTPLPDNSGPFLSPYRSDGTLAEWAQRALTARAAGSVGRAAGRRAGGMLAGRVPGVGGFLGNRVTEASGAAAAAQALGGWDTIRAQSELSFADADSLALYLHVHFAGATDFDKALGATMELYPELKTGYEPAVRRAIQQQRTLARTR